MNKLLVRHWVSVCLILIVMIGFGFRIINIDTNPPELHPDEITNVVSAKAILETGKDINGHLSPYLYYKVQYHPPIYGYTAYFSTKLFGNFPFAIRLPAVLFGLFTVLLLYYLTLEFTGSIIASLIAAGSLAIIPWHIHFSRVGFDTASLLPFILSEMLLLIKGLNEGKKSLILLGFVSAGLTFYTYLSGSFFALLLISSITALNYKYFLRNKKTFIICLIIFTLLIAPFLTLLGEAGFMDRSLRISTFAGGLNQKTVTAFINNYFSHFSLDFLFIKGDPNLRHGAQTGVLYFWILPFILAGLFFLPRVVKKKWFLFLIWIWLLSYPLGGSLTNDGAPHATRSFVGAPVFCILSGIGIWQMFKLIYSKSKILFCFGLFLVILLMLLNLYRFTQKYFLIFPKISSAWWQYGNKEIFSKVRVLQNNYTRACLENLDYWNYETLTKFYLPNTSLQIIQGYSNAECFKPGSIIIVSKPLNMKPTDIIFDLNNSPIFYLYTI